MTTKKIFFIICLLAPLLLQAKAKKKCQSKNLHASQATFSFVFSNTKTIGNIYEVHIEVHANDITIDSVWFGATPVPCDVYETKTLHRISSTVAKGHYLIKANRDLYQNFYRNIDSTDAYTKFVAPFELNVPLAIMYFYKGKRYYELVKTVTEQKQKGMRN